MIGAPPRCCAPMHAGEQCAAGLGSQLAPPGAPAPRLLEVIHRRRQHREAPQRRDGGRQVALGVVQLPDVPAWRAAAHAAGIRGACRASEGRAARGMRARGCRGMRPCRACGGALGCGRMAAPLPGAWRALQLLWPARRRDYPRPPADVLHQQLGVGGLALDVAHAAKQLARLARRDAQVVAAAGGAARLRAHRGEHVAVDGLDLGRGSGRGRSGVGRGRPGCGVVLLPSGAAASAPARTTAARAGPHLLAQDVHELVQVAERGLCVDGGRAGLCARGHAGACARPRGGTSSDELDAAVRCSCCLAESPAAPLGYSWLISFTAEKSSASKTSPLTAVGSFNVIPAAGPPASPGVGPADVLGASMDAVAEPVARF